MTVHAYIEAHFHLITISDGRFIYHAQLSLSLCPVISSNGLIQASEPMMNDIVVLMPSSRPHIWTSKAGPDLSVQRRRGIRGLKVDTEARSIVFRALSPESPNGPMGRRRVSRKSRGEPEPFIVMNSDSILLWRTGGHQIFGCVAAAQHRLSMSQHLNDVSMLAAADELWAANKAATAWLAAHPCPDSQLGKQIERLLNNCAEVALTAQQVATDPLWNTETVRRRIGHLATVISLDARELETW